MKRFGFTLIEIMVSVAIIAVLTSMAAVSFTSAQRNARDGKRKADLEQVRAALVIYRTDAANGQYPPSINWSSMSPIQSSLSSSNVQDPKASPYPQYQYTYNAGQNTFTLCATMEKATPATYCVNSP